MNALYTLMSNGCTSNNPPLSKLLITVLGVKNNQTDKFNLHVLTTIKEFLYCFNYRMTQKVLALVSVAVCHSRLSLLQSMWFRYIPC